ncbi:MAG: 30S ribosomal protein S27e [Candidatus Bathyarchaeota archaeon]|nr:MAG: 30S ribosomal protein S27e [Candidatus Bathyarchaeota archaeon]
MSVDWEDLIPKPKSSFLRVRCPDCGNEQFVYSHPTIKVQCNICGINLAVPTGGKGKFKGEITSELE